jgi:hypothetical protein
MTRQIDGRPSGYSRSRRALIILYATILIWSDFLLHKMPAKNLEVAKRKVRENDDDSPNISYLWNAAAYNWCDVGRGR